METVWIEVKEFNFLEKRFKNKDFVSLADLLSDYEDLLFDVDRLEEEIEDMRNTTEEDEYNSYLDDLRNEKRDLSE